LSYVNNSLHLDIGMEPRPYILKLFHQTKATTMYVHLLNVAPPPPAF